MTQIFASLSFALLIFAVLRLDRVRIAEQARRAARIPVRAYPRRLDRAA